MCERIVLVLLLLIDSMFIMSSNLHRCNGDLGNEVCLIRNIKENIIARRNVIDHLKRRHEMYLEEMPKREEQSQYLGNLPNNFLLVKRLTRIWPPLLLLIKTAFGSGKEQWIKPIKYPLHAENLWTSALTALVRLQETYNITSEVIARGKLRGTHRQSRFTAEDCFDIGVYYLRRLEHPSRALEWLLASLRRIKKNSSVTSAEILEHLYVAQCFKGDSKGAVFTLQSLLEINPSLELSASLKEEYAYIQDSTCKYIAKEIGVALKYLEYSSVHNVQYQRGLCRKENHRPSTDSRLRCRLLDYRHPHLRIRPVKMEELHLDPPILMFHNVIHDHEIKSLIRTYQNRTRYAGKADYDYEQQPYQDTQYNFYIDEDSDVEGLDDRLSKRAAEVSNLKLYRAELSNLASYGIAGELKLHHDIAGTTFDASAAADFATVLFYLTDDQEGGLTIFPDLNLSVIPVKGNALFFFNRWPNLTYVEELTHSGCPVLQGSKWIITKWIHAVGQNFPECGLKEKKSFKYYYL